MKSQKKKFEKILNKKNIGSEISIIVERNLKTSGLFNPLEKEAFLQTYGVCQQGHEPGCPGVPGCFGASDKKTPEDTH